MLGDRLLSGSIAIDFCRALWRSTFVGYGPLSSGSITLMASAVSRTTEYYPERVMHFAPPQHVSKSLFLFRIPIIWSTHPQLFIYIASSQYMDCLAYALWPPTTQCNRDFFKTRYMQCIDNGDWSMIRQTDTTTLLVSMCEGCGSRRCDIFFRLRRKGLLIFVSRWIRFRITESIWCFARVLAWHSRVAEDHASTISCVWDSNDPLPGYLGAGTSYASWYWSEDPGLGISR